MPPDASDLSLLPVVPFINLPWSLNDTRKTYIPPEGYESRLCANADDDNACIDAQVSPVYTPITMNPRCRSATPNARTPLDRDGWDRNNDQREDAQHFSTCSTDSYGFRTWPGKGLSPAPIGDSGLAAYKTVSRRRSMTSPSGGRKTYQFLDSPVPRASLPPFASFQQYPGYPDEPDGPEIAPMSQRIECLSCDNLKPLVRDVAMATADLEGCVQAICNTNVTRMSEIPIDNSMRRTAHWILDRLRYAKIDLQESHKRRSESDATPSVSSQSMPSSNPLKRDNGQYDQTEPKVSKRPRHHGSPEQPLRAETSSTPFPDRRALFDPTTGKGNMLSAAYSPPRSESVMDSIHDSHPSPKQRAMHSLPSPVSSAYMQPRATLSSIPYSTTKSSGSPLMTFRPAHLSHTSSSEPSTSAYLADLEHQIAMKSHALETLQSDYSSLSQTVQSESRKMDNNKTSNPGQNDNGLTSRNQELTEHVRALEAHIKSIEMKREDERAGAAKDKEQWSKMLDMSSRIQAKQAERCQNLKLENDELLRRISTQIKSSPPTSTEKSVLLAVEVDGERTGGTTSSSASPVVLALKREIEALTTRNLSLRGSLEELHNQSLRIHNNTQSVLNIVQRAVSADDRTGVQYFSNTPSKFAPDNKLPPTPWVPLPTSQHDGGPVASRPDTPESRTLTRPTSISVTHTDVAMKGSTKLRPHLQYTSSPSTESAQPARSTGAPIHRYRNASPSDFEHRRPRGQEQADGRSDLATSGQAFYLPSKDSDLKPTSSSGVDSANWHDQSSAMTSPRSARLDISRLLHETAQASPASYDSTSRYFSPVNERVSKQEKQTSMLPPPRPHSSPRSLIDSGA